jgi:hypothetical protein
MKVQATKELLKLEYMKQLFKKDINYEATSHVDVFNSKPFYNVGNVALTTEEFNKYFKIV